MRGDNAIFECEMKVVEIRHKQTEMDDKITKEDEIMLKGADCILVLRRYGVVLTQFNDGEMVKVAITGSK